MIDHMSIALTSLNSALQIANGLTSIRDTAKRQETTVELTSMILEAQAELFTARQQLTAADARITELEQECMRLKDFEAEKKHYPRTEIAQGIFAYVDASSTDNLQQAHKYCCNCFDQNKKSTLQQFEIPEGRLIGLSCHNHCPDLVFWNYLDK